MCPFRKIAVSPHKFTVLVESPFTLALFNGSILQGVLCAWCGDTNYAP